MNLYFQDESRFGLFTKNGKKVTAIGVKPVCRFQQVFQSTYLYGAFSPLNGDHFLLNLPYCNADCFQLFLDEFSKQREDELKVVVLDNGAFHKAKSLIIPSNIILVFLPPYSPELNLAEKMWQKFKRAFTNKLFKKIEELEDFIAEKVKELSSIQVKSICDYNYIFVDNYWSVL